MLLGIILGALGMWFILVSNKSRHYRRVITDLFVVGRIRQIAEDKDIDLAVELEDYRAFMKKRGISSMSLDATIEEELQHEIATIPEIKPKDKKDKK